MSVCAFSAFFFNLCCSTAAILWSGLSEIIQKAATRVALWPSVKSTKRCQSPNPKPRQHHMFASYEIGTSCPSLTAIKRYDLDESADVLLMDHLNYAPYVEYLLSFGVQHIRTRQVREQRRLRPRLPNAASRNLTTITKEKRALGAQGV